jgi:hypothetical protein
MSRTLLATVGGYGFASLFAAALSVLLHVGFGVARIEAVLASTLASFLVWAALALGVFHARSAACAWTWVIAVSLPLAAIVWLLRGAVVSP